MKNFCFPTLSLLTLLLVVVGADSTLAIDIVLREKVTPVKSVVILGDIADIDGVNYADLQRLKLTPLWLAPPVGETRYVTPRQVFDVLVSRGYPATELNVTGAEKLAIGWSDKSAAADTTANASQAAPRTGTQPQIGFRAVSSAPVGPTRAERRQMAQVTAMKVEELKQEVLAAAVEYIETQTGLFGLVDVELELPSRYVDLLMLRSGGISFEGGRNPWFGRQTLSLIFDTTNGPMKLSLPIAAYDMTPVAVVKRPIARGQLITAADVAIEPPAHDARMASGQTRIYQLDDALGKEANRAYGLGDLLTIESCLQPKMIERNALVEMIASGGGIVVRRQAKALTDGRLGDVMEVELLDGSRDRLVGRVVGANKLATVGSSLSSPSPVPGQAAAGYR